MTRMNKTDGNLKTVWQQLDDACGALDNALFNIAMMTDMPKDLKDSADSIDFTAIVILKNHIEELLEAKKIERKSKREFI